jgi:putative hydrolase of the HAD superfamily
MISAFLFDFGGTLDADGQHWLERFNAIYADIGLPEIPKSRIKEAFYWADEQAELDPGMRSAGLRQMMERHLHWQFQKLGLESQALEVRAATAFITPSDRILRRNRHVLEKLNHAGYKLGIVSNFYGNIEALCREFAFFSYLHVILDSALVGFKKPDPKLFKLAMERLKLPAEAIAFVGDSYERDILPAKALGMRTFWLIGDKDVIPPDASKVDHILRSLEDLPHEMKLHKKAAS